MGCRERGRSPCRIVQIHPKKPAGPPREADRPSFGTRGEARRSVRAGELLLGTTTLHQLSAHIGDVVTLRRGKLAQKLRIVGRGALGGGDKPGNGAAITFQTFKRIEPNAAPGSLLVQIAPDVDRVKALTRLEEKRDAAVSRGDAKTAASLDAQIASTKSLMGR